LKLAAKFAQQSSFSDIVCYKPWYTHSQLLDKHTDNSYNLHLGNVEDNQINQLPA